MIQDNKPSQEKEVDLLPIFAWISRGFRNFFDAIGNFFAGIWHYFILFLAFLQRNFIVIGALTLVGIALGFYLDSQAKQRFSGELMVQPNFGSAAQLISNVNYYKGLVKNEEFSSLGKVIGISEDEASQLSDLEIVENTSDNELLIEYDELARESDTMALKNLEFENYKASKLNTDYQQYKINIYGKNSEIIEKTLKSLIDIKDNSAIIAKRKAAVATINYNIKVMEQQVASYDSITMALKQSLENPVAAANSNTNLYLSENSPIQSPIREMFNNKLRLLEDLDEFREDKFKYENTVNVVSSYITKGAIENLHYKRTLTIIFFIIGILTCSIRPFWKFLKNYNK